MHSLVYEAQTISCVRHGCGSLLQTSRMAEFFQQPVQIGGGSTNFFDFGLRNLGMGFAGNH